MCTLVSTLFIDTLLTFVCEYGRLPLAILSLCCELRVDLRGMQQKGGWSFEAPEGPGTKRPSEVLPSVVNCQAS